MTLLVNISIAFTMTTPYSFSLATSMRNGSKFETRFEWISVHSFNSNLNDSWFSNAVRYVRVEYSSRRVASKLLISNFILKMTSIIHCKKLKSISSCYFTAIYSMSVTTKDFCFCWFLKQRFRDFSVFNLRIVSFLIYIYQQQKKKKKKRPQSTAIALSDISEGKLGWTFFSSIVEYWLCSFIISEIRSFLNYTDFYLVRRTCWFWHVFIDLHILLIFIC